MFFLNLEFQDYFLYCKNIENGFRFIKSMIKYFNLKTFQILDGENTRQELEKSREETKYLLG